MKKLWVLILALVVTGVWFFKFRNGLHQEEAAASPQPARLAPQTLREARAAAVPRQSFDERPVAATEEKIPQECTELWENLASKDLNRAFEDFQRGVIRIHRSCQPFEAQSEIAKSAYSACAFNEELGKLADEKACLSNLAFYRAQQMDRLTAQQTDPRMMSLTLLTNKIMARFQGLAGHPEQRHEIAEMLQALIERAPNLNEAYKALVATEMFAMGTPDHDANKFADTIARALEHNPGDPQLTEVYLLNAQMTGHPAVIEQFAQENPGSGIASYFLAWQESKRQNPAAALRHLRRAAELSPGDARIAKTLADVEQGKQGDLFAITLGFTFSDM